jgi:1,4-alpha-glucan branching enzyme
VLDFPVHRGIQLWVKDLNRLYRSEKSLYQRDFEPEGFRWIDCSDAERSIYSFIRYAEDRSDFLVFVCNLTPVPRYHYRVGVPDPGIYDEVLNSDASAYGGSNMGNAGAVHADAIPWQMLGWSLDLTLPPLSVLVLKRRRA